jgi:hypothetical protein
MELAPAFSITLRTSSAVAAALPSGRARLLLSLLFWYNVFMMIQQTIDIPSSRKVHFDVVLPETAQCGKAPVILNFPSVVPRNDALKMSAPQKLSPSFEKALKEAEEKRIYWEAHPDELRTTMHRLQECPPLFGGIGADEFKRRSQNEWQHTL